jgi:cell division protein FtsB
LKFLRRKKTMDKFMKIYERRKLALENRINLLTERGENASIVNKLQRQLRKLEAEYAAYQDAAE